MNGVRMTLRGDKQLKANLNKIQQKTSKLRPLFKQIGVYMLGSVNRTFTSEGKPKWTDIQECTKLQRARIGKYPGKMLQITGRLKRSITFEASNSDVKIGTSVPYAPFLQFGTRNMSDRPFLQFLKTDEKIINKIFERYLQRAILK